MDEGTRPNRQRTVTNGSIEIAVTEYGDPEQPAVILLHGISNRSDGWLPVIPALTESFHVLGVDLRGHGQSSQPASGYGHEDYAGDLQAVVAAYDLSAPLIVGHSLGGMAALTWATRHPRAAGAIVVEDAPLSVAPGAEALFAAWLSLNGLPFEVLLATYQREQPHLPPDLLRRRAEAMAGTAPAVFREELAAARAGDGIDHIAPLAVIESPVLLIRGDPEAGGLVPVADARAFAATVPNSRVERIPGGSHHLHRDRRPAFLELVIPFLREHAGCQPDFRASAR